GAVLPLFSVRLEALHFTHLQTAYCCATQAVGAVVAPLLAGHLADRWFPAERCVAVCAFLAGAALWTLAGLTEPVAVFVAALAFWLAAAPMISLGTALCFAHLARPERQFGPIRLWGTVGWMAAGWFLGYSFRDPEWLRELLALVRPDAPR